LGLIQLRGESVELLPEKAGDASRFRFLNFAAVRNKPVGEDVRNGTDQVPIDSLVAHLDHVGRAGRSADRQCFSQVFHSIMFAYDLNRSRPEASRSGGESEFQAA